MSSFASMDTPPMELLKTCFWLTFWLVNFYIDPCSDGAKDAAAPVMKALLAPPTAEYLDICAVLPAALIWAATLCLWNWAYWNPTLEPFDLAYVAMTSRLCTETPLGRTESPVNLTVEGPCFWWAAPVGGLVNPNKEVPVCNLNVSEAWWSCTWRCICRMKVGCSLSIWL